MQICHLNHVQAATELTGFPLADILSVHWNWCTAKHTK